MKSTYFLNFEWFLCWKSRNYSQHYSLQNFLWDLFISNYYLGSIFTLYLTWGAFSLVCVGSVFFSVFLFLSVFPLPDTKIKRIAGKRGAIIIFVFHFHSLTNIHLVHRDFCYFFLLDLFVITRLSWWDLFSLDICIFIAFLLMLLMQLSHFKDAIDAIKTFQSHIVVIWAHIKLSPFYYKTNGLTNWDWQL